MEDLLVFLVPLLIGLAVGFSLGSAWMRLTMFQLLKELDITVEDLQNVLRKNGIEPPKPELNEISVKIEQHQGVLFAYREDNLEFLGQGSNREELISSISRRLQNVRLKIAEDQGAEYLQKS